MVATDLKEAETLLKNRNRELVVQENNLAMLQTKIQDLIRQKETLQKQIDEKVANANIIMSEQRSKLDVERSFIKDEREKLELGKKEVARQIEILREDKANFTKEKETNQNFVAASKQARINVDQFILSVKRAYDVLG